METEASKGYSINVHIPSVDDPTTDNQVLPNLDNTLLRRPRSVDSSTVSKKQTAQTFSSSPHSAGDESVKISLSPKVDEGLTIARPLRRKSILESTMLEQSSGEKIISVSDHSISSILSSHVNDFVKIIKTVTEVEESLTENMLEINPMQNFVAHAKKINDPKHQKSTFKSNPAPTKGLKEDLDAAVDFIRVESAKATLGTQKPYYDKILKIVNDRQEKVESLKSLRNGIQSAQKKALETETKRNEDALKGFSLKFEKMMLPKVPLQLDNVPFKAYNLVSDPPVNIGNEEIPLDQKIKNLMDKIKKVEIARTDSRVKRGWWMDPSMKIIDIEKHGVLEMDSESIRNKNGALEEQQHFALPSVLKYSPEELIIMQRMNTRKTYLKNPRFRRYSALPDIKTSFDSLTQEDSNSNVNRDQGIFSEPRVVHFTNYEVGKAFFRTLHIRNKTQHSHRFRLEPVSPNQYSHNFTYCLSKSPIKNNGLVAPGMTCSYIITFIPDSLADVTFMLNVMTETGDSFTVPICAQRVAPILTLPNSLHCGPCRAGFIAHRKWEFQNTGGPGRFMIIKGTENIDPYTMIKSIEADLTADEEVVFQDGPFEIYPAYFTMEAMEKKTLHVTYIAKEIDFSSKFEEIFERHDRIMIKIGCDNGQMLELPIVATAQTCRLEICKFESRNTPISFGKNENHPSSFTLEFGGSNPYAVTSSLIVVKNKTQLKLPFKWIAYDNPGNFGKEISYDSIVKSESIQVIPSKGWILPDSETAFEINFSPEKVRKYDVFTDLLICNDLQKSQDIDLNENEVSIQVQCLGEGLHYNVDVSPPMILLSGRIYALEMFYTEIRLRNQSVSNIAFEWFLENLDASVLDIEMTHISGAIPSNETIIIGINIFAKFPIRLDGNLVCVTGHGMGPELKIPIQGDVQLRASTICFDEELVDFGLLALGNACSRRITVVNTSNYAVSWSLFGSNRENESKETPQFHLIYDPKSGILDPHEKQVVDILYVPLWQQSFRGLLECKVIGIWTPGQQQFHSQIIYPPVTASAIQIKAEVQTPQLHVLNPKNYVTAFLGVSFDWTIMLQNITMIPTKYRWRPNQFPNILVVFPDDGGELGGKETREVSLKITFLNLGSFPNISFLIEVEDMVDDQGFVKVELHAAVFNIDVSLKIIGNKGLPSIPYTTRPHEADEGKISHISSAGSQLRFDFGSDCPIFGTRMRSLILRNMSSACQPFKLWFENFTATVDDELLEKILPKTPSSNAEKIQLLKSTPRSKLGFSSKSGQNYIDNINKVRIMVQQMQDLLKNGKGAAFNPTPKEGLLEPWAEVKIDIISYNNLVGIYEDKLHLEVGNSIHEIMAVQLKVVGTAVKFNGAQLVSNKKNISGWIDRINFGSRIVNLNWKGTDGVRVQSSSLPNSAYSERRSGETFSKSINIENQSPRTAILNWKVYIQYKTSSEQIGPCEMVDTFSIIKETNMVKENDIGIFEIVPKSMTIASFKTMPLKVIFRSARVGTYNALAIAEVGYLEHGGDLIYAPVKPNTKLYEKSLARIHIQGKVIEPRLTLEEMDHIRIKRKIKVQNTEDPEDYKTVNAFIKNNSDAICSFQIEAFPTDLFAIKSCSSKLTTSNGRLFQLKPTEQMLIAVSFTPSKTEDKTFHKLSDDTEISPSGELKITFSNGMIQSFSIEVCG